MSHFGLTGPIVLIAKSRPELASLWAIFSVSLRPVKKRIKLSNLSGKVVNRMI
jgi:hypothetical protein